MKMFRTVAAAAAMLVIGASGAQAQAIGIQGVWGDDTDLGLGARLEWGLNNVFTNQGPFSRTFLITELNYFFPDCDPIDCGFLEINANVAVPITANTIDPYAGLGLNIARFSVEVGDDDESETEVGLNLLGGLRFRMGNLGAYTEGRFVLSGAEQFVLTFGILVGGGR
jgi:hypothetical protein